MINKKHSIKFLLENDNALDEFILETEESTQELVSEISLGGLFSKLVPRRLEKYGREIAGLSKKFPSFFSKVGAIGGGKGPSAEEIEDAKNRINSLYKLISNDDSLSGEERNNFISDLRRNLAQSIIGSKVVEKRAPRSTEQGQKALDKIATSDSVLPEVKRQAELEKLLRTLKDIDPSLKAKVPGKEEQKELSDATKVVQQSQDPKKEAEKQAQALMSNPAFAALGYPTLVQMIGSGGVIQSGMIGSLQDVSDVAPEDIGIIENLRKIYLKQRLPQSRARIRAKNLLMKVAKLKDDLEDEDKELNLSQLEKFVNDYNSGFTDKISPKAVELIIDELSKHFKISQESEEEGKSRTEPQESGQPERGKLSREEVVKMMDAVLSDFSTNNLSPPSRENLDLLFTRLNDAGILDSSWNDAVSGDETFLNRDTETIKDDLISLHGDTKVNKILTGSSIPAGIKQLFGNDFSSPLGKVVLDLIRREAIRESLFLIATRGFLKGITPVIINEEVRFIHR